MKPIHAIHRHKSLSNELRSKWASKCMSEVEYASKVSKWMSEQCKQLSGKEEQMARYLVRWFHSHYPVPNAHWQLIQAWIFMGLAFSRGLTRMTFGYGLLHASRCTGLKFMPQVSRIQIIFRCQNKEKHGKISSWISRFNGISRASLRTVSTIFHRRCFHPLSENYPPLSDMICVMRFEVYANSIVTTLIVVQHQMICA